MKGECDDNSMESGRILDLLFSYMPKIAAERKMDNLLILMADLGRSMVSADRCSLWLIDNQKVAVLIHYIKPYGLGSLC